MALRHGLALGVLTAVGELLAMPASASPAPTTKPIDLCECAVHLAPLTGFVVGAEFEPTDEAVSGLALATSFSKLSSDRYQWEVGLMEVSDLKSDSWALFVRGGANLALLDGRNPRGQGWSLRGLLFADLSFHRGNSECGESGCTGSLAILAITPMAGLELRRHRRFVLRAYGGYGRAALADDDLTDPWLKTLIADIGLTF